MRHFHEFSGHKYWDGDNNSEMAVPILKSGEVVAVIDLDCLATNGFDKADGKYLEKTV